MGLKAYSSMFSLFRNKKSFNASDSTNTLYEYPNDDLSITYSYNGEYDSRNIGLGRG